MSLLYNGRIFMRVADSFVRVKISGMRYMDYPFSKIHPSILFIS